MCHVHVSRETCYNGFLLINIGEINMPRFKIHYTADIWETVIVEAENKKKAQLLFETHDDDYFEAREDEPEQMGMENIKVDIVEELK
jgi:hypothetical protein